jgi:hypothetical protein
MEGTISRFNRAVCDYFTLGEQPKTCGNSQTSEWVLWTDEKQFRSVPSLVQTFRDEVGRLIVYKSKAPSNYSIGERVRVTATVKDHSEYRGVKQTIISRPKVVPSG